jgi:hypothetical protein
MLDPVPHEIRQLADDRSRARRAHDWATADRLKGELEAAGWKVIDAASLYSLERLPDAVVEVDGVARYGTSEAVPSVLDEPAAGPASVVIVADAVAGLLERAVAAVRASSPEAQVIVVANDPAPAIAAEVDALDGVEVVRLAQRLGAAAARNAGIRRATGRAVVLLDPFVEPQGDLATDLARALDDPQVGVAGLRGLVTDDLVRVDPAGPDGGEPAAVDLLAVAFRRMDFVERGPLDEHFTATAYLDAWWSLMLRDVPDDAVFGVDVPRRAAVVTTPYALHGEPPAEPDERVAKKHRYRFLKYFAIRRDLVPGQGE